MSNLNLKAKKTTLASIRSNIEKKEAEAVFERQGAQVSEDQPKQFTASSIVVSPYVSQSARHLEEARMEMCKEETSKSIDRFFSCHERMIVRAENWNALEWYAIQERNHAEWLVRREAERKAALGIVSCAYPEEWRKLVSGKNILHKEIGSFLVSLCREHGKADCYSIAFEDLVSLTPSFHKNGAPRSQDERGRMIVTAFAKFAAPMVPVFDQFTGMLKSGAFEECKLKIERIEKTFDHLVYFQY